ncbi:MAG: hypothetical protein ACYTF7_01460 [Planctomycetota bacterium]|jgi:hypothetical protein
MSELQQALLQTTATRDRAEALLEGLMRAKDEVERERARQNRVDLMQQVVGRTSIDNAIASTRRMIDTLNRILRETRRELASEKTLDFGPRPEDAPLHAHFAIGSASFFH